MDWLLIWKNIWYKAIKRQKFKKKIFYLKLGISRLIFLFFMLSGFNFDRSKVALLQFTRNCSYCLHFGKRWISHASRKRNFTCLHHRKRKYEHATFIHTFQSKLEFVFCMRFLCVMATILQLHSLYFIIILPQYA